jgi:mycothiol synthase
MNDSLSIFEIDIRQASQDEYKDLNIFANHMQSETLPHDPPLLLEDSIQKAKSLVHLIELPVWVAYQDNRIVARAELQILQIEQNRHMANFDIQVLPDYRTKGMARALLRNICDRAEQHGRRLLMTNTNNRVLAGAVFMQNLGAHMALESHSNQLDLRELDQGLIQNWLTRVATTSSGFELLFWDGAFPETHLAAFTQLFAVMNSVPRGNLEIEDFVFTPDLLRLMEQSWFAQGLKHWTMVVREFTTGNLVGYTDITWNPKQPLIVQQQHTGVLATHRDLGLGRWLKAAMLEKILLEIPQARFIRTNNADINAPMLKINFELGFKPHVARAQWQVNTSQVRTYLERERK